MASVLKFAPAFQAVVDVASLPFVHPPGNAEKMVPLESPANLINMYDLKARDADAFPELRDLIVNKTVVGFKIERATPLMDDAWVKTGRTISDTTGEGAPYTIDEREQKVEGVIYGTLGAPMHHGRYVHFTPLGEERPWAGIWNVDYKNILAPTPERQLKGGKRSKSSRRNRRNSRLSRRSRK